jgi:hypothetical protein
MANLNSQLHTAIFFFFRTVHVVFTQSECKLSAAHNYANGTVRIPAFRVGQSELTSAMNCISDARYSAHVMLTANTSTTPSHQSLDTITTFVSAALLSIPRYARLFVLAVSYQVRHCSQAHLPSATNILAHQLMTRPGRRRAIIFAQSRSTRRPIASTPPSSRRSSSSRSSSTSPSYRAGRRAATAVVAAVP